MCLMNFEKMLPINLGGIGNNDCSEIEKIKWWLIITILYIVIIATDRKYKDLFYCGSIVRYDSYNKWKKMYLFDITRYILSVTIINYILVFDMDYIDTGFLAVILLTLNFVLKASVIFFISNRKNLNFVICIFVVFEALCVQFEKYFDVFIFEWAMFNKSSLVNDDGYSVVAVIMCEIILIYILYRLEFVGLSYKSRKHLLI